MTRTILIISAVLLLTVSMVAAQEEAAASYPDSPKALADAVTSALKQQNWNNFASYVHPQSLKDFKAELWPAFVTAKQTDTTGQAGMFLSMFGIEANAMGQLQEPTPSEFLGNILSGVVQMQPQLAQMLSMGTASYVGQVNEGDSLVHVLERVTVDFQGQSVSEMDVTTCRQADGQWKVVLGSDIKGLAMQLKQGMGQ